MIKELYYSVVKGNVYDLNKANNHNFELASQNPLAKDIPSMALFKLMRDKGIEAYISITLEANPETGDKTDLHVSVCYVQNSKLFIADPVETIKKGYGEYFDIPIEDFYKANGTIWIYDPYGEFGDK